MSKSESHPETIRAELERSLGPAEWSLLRQHLARDVLITVSTSIDLIEAALAVALNQKERIQSWIEEGKIGKPDLASIQLWEKDPSRSFLCVVVQPFVLIQNQGN
jgi:hypothetical protein